MEYKSSKELVEDVAEKTGASKYMVDKMLTALSREVQRSLSDGKTVKIRGIGSFSARKRPGRKIYAPSTGKIITTSDKTIVTVKPDGKLRAEAEDHSSLSS